MARPVVKRVARIEVYTDHVWVQRLLRDNGANGCWVTDVKQVESQCQDWYELMGESRKAVGIRRYLYAMEHRAKVPNGTTFVTSCGTAKCCNPRHLQIKDVGDGEAVVVKRPVGRPAKMHGKEVARRVLEAHLWVAVLEVDPIMADATLRWARDGKFQRMPWFRRKAGQYSVFHEAMYRSVREWVLAQWAAGREDALTVKTRAEIEDAFNGILEDILRTANDDELKDATAAAQGKTAALIRLAPASLTSCAAALGITLV